MDKLAFPPAESRLTDEPIRARPYQIDDTLYVQATDGVVAAYRFAR